MLKPLRILALCGALAPVLAAAPIKALLIDGQNNHAWQQTSPVLKKILEEDGLFRVDVMTTPPKGGDMKTFQPRFSRYKVVVMNYVGDDWTPAVQAAFEKFVSSGGGVVIYHAADNAFREWKAFNEMIAVGGWGNRTEKDGPYVRWRNGKVVLEQKPGPTGHHGKRLPFAVDTRAPQHPVMAGLPERWMQSADELYNSLRGPAKNLTVLATAWSDPANSGTGENEPMLMDIRFGKGRIFHTALGHDPESMRSVGFIVTLRRGTEWAATGKVKQKVPADFPTADKPSVR
jgi:uncharacterized protein